MNTTAAQIARRAALRLTVNTTVAGALFAAVLGGMATQDETFAARPYVVNANTLAADHDCSASVKDPSHVVVTTKDGVTRYAGQAMTNRAIEQEMFGMDHGLTVHAFCA